ncbi:hypothetical protein BH11PLA2_BH11PLA2_32380 [soil metagenome]
MSAAEKLGECATKLSHMIEREKGRKGYDETPQNNAVPLALVLLTAILYAALWPRPVVVTVNLPPVNLPPPEPVGTAGDAQYFGGWHNDPDAVNAVAATLPDKRFSDTPAFKAFRGNDTGTVLLSDHAKKALGHHVPVRNQGGVGSCVSFGTAAAIEYLICVQIVKDKARPTVK